ncbi:MAG TPA: DUF2249 domain-containing protein [Actinotalea sp.]|nr:DUF2249 domain-containing protein [Actinotalea sp.]
MNQRVQILPTAPETRSGGCGCGGHDEHDPVLDVRTIPHAVRHGAVFGAFDAIAPGRSMVLVAPHAPTPLLAQLAERALIDVETLVDGPSEWHLRVTRRVVAGDPTSTPRDEPAVERTEHANVTLDDAAVRHLAAARSNEHGRSAELLVHDGALRQTILALAAGAELAEHNSPHAASLQVLSGSVHVTGMKQRLLVAGELVALTHQRHAVRADQDAVFLLTTVTGQPGDVGTATTH